MVNLMIETWCLLLVFIKVGVPKPSTRAIFAWTLSMQGIIFGWQLLSQLT